MLHWDDSSFFFASEFAIDMKQILTECVCVCSVGNGVCKECIGGAGVWCMKRERIIFSLFFTFYRGQRWNYICFGSTGEKVGGVGKNPLKLLIRF